MIFIHILLFFYLILLSSVVLSSLFGISIGIRELYINCILKLFEIGKERIEIAKRKKHTSTDDASDDCVPVARTISDAIWNHEETCTQQDKNSDVKVHSTFEKAIKNKNSENSQKYYELEDCFEYIQSGLQSIINDEVTCCFDAEELSSWNLLTRTNCYYEFISIRLTVLWVLGFLCRYFIFFPFRLIILALGLSWMIISTATVGLLPPGKIKQHCNVFAMLTSFRMLSHVVTLHARYHQLENMPKNGICVSNHTSPIDSLVLGYKTCFALIGQKHGGLLGIMERALSRASQHIWFERRESSDRHFVLNLLKEHINHPDSLPILIFPEGTCINNTSVMMFKKGSFEVGSIIYPVAIKYDQRFGDAFWDSSRYGYMMHLFRLMTSWAVVCDVWYLPPMVQNKDETAIQFANRVKSAIAMKGGLVDLLWDGQLKRMKVKKEWKEKMQEEFSRRYKTE